MCQVVCQAQCFYSDRGSNEVSGYCNAQNKTKYVTLWTIIMFHYHHPTCKLQIFPSVFPRDITHSSMSEAGEKDALSRKGSGGGGDSSSGQEFGRKRR